MKNIFRGDKIKAFLFAFLISMSLWIYSALNSQYTTFVKVPLKIILPEKFSLSGKIPYYLDVQISATGWQILNLSFISKGSYCMLTISEYSIKKDKNITISKEDFLKNLQLEINARVLDIIPNNLTIEVGVLTEKIVPIVSKVDIIPRENFTIVGKPKLQPNYVVVRGLKEVLDQIEYWETENFAIFDAFAPVEVEVPLKDTMQQLVSLSLNRVKLIADIDIVSEVLITDVPVVVEQGSEIENHIIEPMYVDVWVRSGVNYLSQVDLSNVVAKVSQSEVLKDTTGIITPRVELPEGIALVSIEPNYVYHWRRIQSPKVIQR